MSASLKEVARLVGVSPNTVSRALRGMPDISNKTTDRVKKVAEMIGYRPNGLSRALRYQMFHSIGVLSGSAEEVYLPLETLDAFSQVLVKNGYSCSLVYTSKMDAEHINQAPLVKARLVDALIVAYVQDLPSSVLDSLTKMGTPIVWLNRRMPSDAVVVDERDAVDQIMEHLAECNYNDVMYVDYTSGGEGWLAQNRLLGFEAAAERLKMRTRRFAHRRVVRNERFEVTRSWLSEPDRPRAVIVNSLSGAIAVMQTAIYMGMRIPDDLAIASFDDGKGCTVPIPSITCAIRPEFQVGVAAAEMALQKSKNPTQELPTRCIKFTLALGGSTQKTFNS